MEWLIVWAVVGLVAVGLFVSRALAERNKYENLVEAMPDQCVLCDTIVQRSPEGDYRCGACGFDTDLALDPEKKALIDLASDLKNAHDSVRACQQSTARAEVLINSLDNKKRAQGQGELDHARQLLMDSIGMLDRVAAEAPSAIGGIEGVGDHGQGDGAIGLAAEAEATAAVVARARAGMRTLITS